MARNLASSTSNPFDAFLDGRDAVAIQALFSAHRTNRNTAQYRRLLDPKSGGITPDEVLIKCLDHTLSPRYIDVWQGIDFWARPTKAVVTLIGRLQQRLEAMAPNSIWCMPSDDLHITVLEIDHHKTPEEISALVSRISPHLAELLDYPCSAGHRVRLVKPLLSFDAGGIALTFLPAAGEQLLREEIGQGDEYTYLHLRKEMFDMAQLRTGLKCEARYVHPSAHVTIARFISTQDLHRPEQLSAYLNLIQSLNAELQSDWHSHHNSDKLAGEWFIGEERGLELRAGDLWYGGGYTALAGRGF